MAEERNPKDPEDAEEKVDDLDVSEEESEDVKGGLSLNFSKIEYQQKVSPTFNTSIDQNLQKF